MKEATIVYPHQLFADHPAIAPDRVIYLVEEPLFLTEFPVHTQKLLLHRLSLQAYKQHLENNEYTVRYLAVEELSGSTEVFAHISADNITRLHIVDTTDNWLEKRINAASKKYNLALTRYESPLFLLEKAEAVERYQDAKKHMARFYKQLRINKKILLTKDEKPSGGQWSFDEDNRKKIPKNQPLPDDLGYFGNSDTKAALEWLKTVPAECYGEEKVWLPYTHAGAESWLETFLHERLAHFGTYEDAIVTDQARLFHSTLSPLINIGLLTPHAVLEAVITYGEQHDIALNNIEGFVRQILGWREFIRASYECDGSDMRTQNFWNHQRNIPDSYWSGSTGLVPVDIAINTALAYGYNHHIERLMVLGNSMLLSQIAPTEVYRWFMAMYVDAYDWVMVPNVYGMSQFADGGSIATKPYISGSNYLKKMSDYPTGDWEAIWTALYWQFIATNESFFSNNHRLAMMPRLLNKMSAEKKSGFKKKAKDYLSSLS